jgi:hypothetical protein
MTHSVSQTLRKTAARYLARVRAGEFIMRDSAGRLQWASGKSVGPRTVAYGDFSRGQTIGGEVPA